MKRFKLNKIVLLCLALPVVVLTSCSRRSQVSDKGDSLSMLTMDKSVFADTLNSEMKFMLERELVLQQVKGIYSAIKADYALRGGVFDSELFDKCYCSKSWNELLMQVRCKEERTNTLFFEINPWSMTRFSGCIVEFDEFEVSNLVIEPEKKASVSFTVYESDAYTPARIDLVYENGRWVIDNFYNLKYMLDVRNCMWQYLATDIV